MAERAATCTDQHLKSRYASLADFFDACDREEGGLRKEPQALQRACTLPKPFHVFHKLKELTIVLLLESAGQQGLIAVGQFCLQFGEVLPLRESLHDHLKGLRQIAVTMSLFVHEGSDRKV